MYSRADDNEYDMAGMDDTWIDSQLDTAVTAAAGDDTDSDTDSDSSDVIPQYDGPMDERTKGTGSQVACWDEIETLDSTTF